ncbi:hypothetical protein PO78_3328 [Thauera sp. SWB20]|nr:hypothetical protein PO78_3328 [Thauera sp. SWB20]
MPTYVGVKGYVSIPLISGHQSGRIVPDPTKNATNVSIPLISGHQSGLLVLVGTDIVDVSIPLISGHQSGQQQRRN